MNIAQRNMQKVIWTVLISGIIVAIIWGLYTQTTPVADIPSTHFYGNVTSFSSGLIENATAQVNYIGIKPILQIKLMNIQSCPIATVFAAQATNIAEVQISPQVIQQPTNLINLGAVVFPTGNTNYEYPFTVKPQTYPLIIVWCNLTNTSLGYALLQ